MPTLRTALSGILAVAASTWTASAELTPEALIQAHLKALGGREQISAIETQVSQFEGQEGEQAFTVKVSFKAPGQLLMEASAPGGFTIRQGYDGQRHWWRQDPNGIREIGDATQQLEFREMSLALSARAVLDLPKHFPQLSVLGEEKVGSVDCQILEAKSSDGKSLKLLFDKQTGLLRKAGKSLLNAYQAEAGIQVPHEIQNGSGLRLKLKSVAFNTSLADTQFAMPAAASVAGKGNPEVDQYATSLNADGQLGIVRHPAPTVFGRAPLSTLPAYAAGSGRPFQVDLRGVDVSSASVEERLADLLHADFDSKTVWPKSLPADFDPAEILEVGKNPGLGVRALHRQGITGKGVGLAIIDQPLLVEHTEYKDRLRSYEEIHSWSGAPAQMHGPAVASLAVGKTIGVAPGADLYYIAEVHGTGSQGKFEWDFTWLAKSIERVLEINRSLPPAQKIRVISVSVGWSPQQKGCAETDAAVQKATAQGVFVISTALERTHKLAFHGLGRDSRKDPDLFESYGLGSWWAKSFLNGRFKFQPGERLLVPMDARSTASPTGEMDYVYYSDGGWSWSVPYLAGLYALACQVNPAVTPEKFWEAGLKTGRTITLQHEGTSITLGTIVQPEVLLQTLRKSGA